MRSLVPVVLAVVMLSAGCGGGSASSSDAAEGVGQGVSVSPPGVTPSTSGVIESACGLLGSTEYSMAVPIMLGGRLEFHPPFRGNAPSIEAGSHVKDGAVCHLEKTSWAQESLPDQEIPGRPGPDVQNAYLNLTIHTDSALAEWVNESARANGSSHSKYPARTKSGSAFTDCAGAVTGVWIAADEKMTVTFVLGGVPCDTDGRTYVENLLRITSEK